VNGDQALATLAYEGRGCTRNKNTLRPSFAQVFGRDVELIVDPLDDQHFRFAHIQTISRVGHPCTEKSCVCVDFSLYTALDPCHTLCMGTPKQQSKKEQVQAEIRRLVQQSGATMTLALVARKAYLEGVLTLDEIEKTVRGAKTSKRGER
jgi:hypothetical protein